MLAVEVGWTRLTPKATGLEGRKRRVYASAIFGWVKTRFDCNSVNTASWFYDFLSQSWPMSLVGAHDYFRVNNQPPNVITLAHQLITGHCGR